jgi:hypothetical protein
MFWSKNWRNPVKDNTFRDRKLTDERGACPIEIGADQSPITAEFGSDTAGSAGFYALKKFANKPPRTKLFLLSVVNQAAAHFFH